MSSADQPVLVIAPDRSVRQRLAAVWRYRELLMGLIRKELKVKYKDSSLGFLWSMLNPAMYLAVFYVVFKVILGSPIPNFAIYLLSGLLAWNLFSASVMGAVSSVVANGPLVNKVYFPREILPLSVVGATVVHFFLQSVVLLGTLMIFRYGVALEYLWLIPIALVVLLVLTSGLAILFAACNVYARDLQHLLELALLAWFWMTPIVYPWATPADKLVENDLPSGLTMINPITPIVLTLPARHLRHRLGHRQRRQRHLPAAGRRAALVPAQPPHHRRCLHGHLRGSGAPVRPARGQLRRGALVSAAIQIRGVSKRFRVSQDRQSSLKERIVHLGRAKRGHKDFWALRDIDLDVAQGETVGLLGHNGSGKSTLLKCVGGILSPTDGEIRVRGRVASLLELGAGFHPDLTGRENVFLNAAILGLARRDIEKRFDDIVAFAELEEFIDEQVKHYSSGMYIRLGFAVAINVDPDVLLVDEVLAVGDEAFQQKCLERVRHFQEEGRTIMFVSHAAELMRRICDRVSVLERGRQITTDDPQSAILMFREHLLGERLDDSEVLEHGHRVTKELRIAEVRITGPSDPERHFVRPDEPVHIHVRYETDQRLDDITFALELRDVTGTPAYGCNTDVLGQPIDHVEGEGWITFTLDPALVDGVYSVFVGAHTHDIVTEYDFVPEAAKLTIVGGGGVVGIANLRAKVSDDPPS